MRHWVLAIALLVLSSARLGAQRIIHDQSRDKTSQDAESIAKQVSGGDLFTKMLHNIDLQAKQEVDTQMAYVEQQMRAKIENFTFWTSTKDKASQVKRLADGSPFFIAGKCWSVVCELTDLQIKLNAFLNNPADLTSEQVNAKLAELKSKKDALDQALAQLQSSAKSRDPIVLEAFTRLVDNCKDVVDYAKKISDLNDDGGRPMKGLLSALDRLGEGLDQIRGVYSAVKGMWDGYRAIDVDPASLQRSQEQIDLLLLAVEEDHLKTIARIRAREYVEACVTLNRITTALSRLKSVGVWTPDSSDVRVEDTLRAAALEAAQSQDRTRLVELLDVLHEAAAAVAEEDASSRLAELRLSDEERRYSIRRSAVNSSTYDQAIQAASQRLALYWKSGIKPSDLAQLLLYLTNTAGVSAIAAK